MIILGIDPGLAIVGYGVVEYKSSKFRVLSYGAILTPAKTKVSDRLVQIGRELDGIISAYHPEEMAIEELFFGANHTTALPWRRRGASFWSTPDPTDFRFMNISLRR